MPTGESIEDLALAEVERAREALLTTADYAELAHHLPADFARQLFAVAWEHQFDLEHAAFRRAARELIESASIHVEAARP